MGYPRNDVDLGLKGQGHRVSKSIFTLTTITPMSWRPLANYAVKVAWCICSVKSCVIHAERFRSRAFQLRRYTNGIPLHLMHI